MLHYYDEPNISYSSFDSVLFVGDTTELSFKQERGKDGGWSYLWNDGSTANTYKFIAKKAGDNKVTVVIN